jgi:hypothetical protein
MPRGFQQNEGTVLKMFFDVASDNRRRDSVRIALQNERRRRCRSCRIRRDRRAQLYIYRERQA